MREALKTIADMHLGDQPASSDLDERAWAMKHIAEMRRIAEIAFKRDHRSRHPLPVTFETALTAGDRDG